jgi:hypothetical protein
MKILVKTLKAAAKPIELDVDPSRTIKDLKREVIALEREGAFARACGVLQQQQQHGFV